MYGTKLGSGIGALLILAGIVVPAPLLIEFLRASPGDLLEQLLVGATLFKIGLVLLGLLVITLGRMSIWRAAIRSEKPLPDPRRKFISAILVAILLAASALRFYRLDAGLWLDEMLTYVLYAKMPFGEIISTYQSENQHFLYSLLAHFSFWIFGESAWSLRLPAVLFGIGSIWALYVLGRQVGSAREALLAAALLAFSYHHVWFSQNARGYTGLLFWTIVASSLFLRGLGEARPQVWLLYAAAAALGVYTNLAMLFVLIGHFIIINLATLFARRKEIWPRRWAGLFPGFGLAGFLTFQLHALALPQMLGGIARTTSDVESWKDPLWTLVEVVKGMQVGFAGGAVAIVALLAFGAGVWSFARTNPVVIQLLVIPALIGAAVVMGMGHHLWPRFFFFTVGFGALIIVRGTLLVGHMIAQFRNFAPARSASLGVALCTGLIALSAMSVPFAYAPKQDYLGALAFVEARKEPGDAIVTVSLATFPYKNFYMMDWEAVETLEALNAIRSRAKRTWLLYTFPPVVQTLYPEIMASIKRDFDVVKEFYGSLGGGTIFVCRSDIPPHTLRKSTTTFLAIRLWGPRIF